MPSGISVAFQSSLNRIQSALQHSVEPELQIRSTLKSALTVAARLTQLTALDLTRTLAEMMGLIALDSLVWGFRQI